MATLAYPKDCPCCESTLHSLDDLKEHLRTRQSQVQALEDELFRVIERTEFSAPRAIPDTQTTDTTDTGSDDTNSLSERRQLIEGPSRPANDPQVESDSSQISNYFIDQSEKGFMHLLKNGSPQYIDAYRRFREQRYFELRVAFKENTGQPSAGLVHYWIPEATVQKFDNAAVCTYWHARLGADGKPVGRPYDEVDLQVLKIVGYKDRSQAEFWVQTVGDPVLHPGLISTIEKWSDDPEEPEGKALFRYRPTYMTVAEVRDKWPRQYEHWMNGAKRQEDRKALQVLYGHRANLNHERFEISRLAFNWAPTWCDEKVVHNSHPFALITYFKSDPKVRTGENDMSLIAPRIFKIVRWRRGEDGQLLFTYQKLGESELEDDLEEGDLRAVEKLDKKMLGVYRKKNRL
ncbi:uncharacterized protein FFUJ_06808 [Fusarium fujikuroi IMI 58289]|uniref:Uncharacterized protein n=1 Tax=Gibberella fujikuroi (strain CBS 195.34 / IMI 58289 / NRRL A-6831) TaxID=1279085 RepID=S0E355_GIBF5|nr:uncharacterized protein FFUJ_06808 [Fusarium fujikuroi IMI 58289]KLP05165.1 uncharacterized protein LW94_143 [Fusarium fujikuroi]CCT68052.1 uncharacterized protein FFUJ_06808 [Fusarium fujikuroi IMI 58289]SCN93846.1 uncharacterized protein FFM5_05825 [Fusarium fujikuroi]SCO46764.1 uncharacterized protein FFMR_08703 [Fusarium fujikuroi]